MSDGHAPVLVTAGRDRLAEAVHRADCGARCAMAPSPMNAGFADALLASGAVVAINPADLTCATYRPSAAECPPSDCIAHNHPDHLCGPCKVRRALARPVDTEERAR